MISENFNFVIGKNAADDTATSETGLLSKGSLAELLKTLLFLWIIKI